MTAKKFRNFTTEDFTWKYDGVAFTFPAGQETYLEDYKADHFAQHLVDREINKANALRVKAGQKEVPTTTPTERQPYLDQCFPVGATVTQAEALDINEKNKEKKARKEKKVDEFPGLKDN